MEIFYTLQGEGEWSGHAAHFIRLAGCDVGCVWCDVKESWDASAFPNFTSEEIADQLEEGSSDLVVITGGEPAMYDLNSLCQLLHERNYRIHIETSGAYELKGNFDWVCFSPKKFKKPIEQIFSLAHELKIIVYNKSDFEWAENYKGEVNADCKLFLQPEWDRKTDVYPLIVEYVKKQPEWQISVQTHKYLNIP
ncbi:MAG: radical SAM protein [Flavobacteriales bacterium]|nr:radical SAM protein [Flavobacteriales bacterium]